MAQEPMTVEYYSHALGDVTRAIAEKCQVLGDILATSHSKFDALDKRARESVFHQLPLIDEMDRVFHQLRGITVAHDAVASSSSGKTLFDYVDAETVQLLQQDAREQTKEIEEMLGLHHHALSRITAIYQYFRSFETKYGSQIDRIMKSTANPDERHHDLQTFDHLYDTSVRFFVDMEQCDRFLLAYFTKINDVYPQYDAAFGEADALFDELRSLRDFYRHFLASYLQFGPELHRRQQYDEKVTALLHDTMAKLRIYNEEEQLARARFAQNHGRFLPLALCSELKDIPEQYDIVAVNNEHEKDKKQ